jgi:hypothetical protein
VAFSAGGDGVRKSPEHFRATPHIGCDILGDTEGEVRH